MFSALILAATLGAFSDEAAPAQPKPDLAAYNEATAKAGKTADAQVRLALWCEAHGMTAERLKHLSLAVLYDPTNALARGLMGLVAYHGKVGTSRTRSAGICRTTRSARHGFRSISSVARSSGNGPTTTGSWPSGASKMA